MPSEPLVLGFDTSAAHCAAALLCGGTVLSTTVEEMKRGQAERLMPLLEQLLADSGFCWGDLTLLGVGIGPGNFTGIRISVAAARGLALALKIPAVGASTFEATLLDQHATHAATVSAPRDQLYALLPGGVPHLATGPLQTDFPVLTPPHPARLAENIARMAQRGGLSTDRPAPLYIKAADAAPPRHPAPKILT